MQNIRKNVSFSDYVDTYKKEVQSSINFAGQELDFFIKLKADLIVQIARNYFENPESIKILDIGSGIGLTDHHLSKYFQNLYGTDIEEEVVSKAKSYNKDVNYSLYNGLSLPFDQDFFDMVFAINVMHHVPPGNWKNFVKEMHRIVKPGGISSVFEHNPLNPLTRLAVSRCEFDKDAVLIHKKKLKKIFMASGFGIAREAYIVFFPFRGKIFRGTEKIIPWLPLGAQYFLAGKK